MEAVREEIDSLSSLEQRIVKAVALVGELREERDLIMKELDATIAAKQSAEATITEREAEIARLQQQLQSMQSEQQQVKSRISKVLEQLDLIGSH